MGWRFVSSILEVAPADWNALCPVDYPFIRHEFLAALEQSGCTTLKTGWQPHHLIFTRDKELLAALPLYIKYHSYGEYVFDWSWADAYRRYGQDYYPKLVSAIPFTPCYGARLLQREENFPSIAEVMKQIQDEAERLQCSGWHCLFPSAVASSHWCDVGIFQRLGCQFHWFNKEYHSFDDFLARMNSRKRKNISRERRELHQQGIYFEWLEGSDIRAQDWSDFYQLYRATYLKRSGHEGYLTAAFFQQLGAQMPEHLVLINACRQDDSGQKQRLASAFFLRDQHNLYGRYWGCVDEQTFLHFETCYYQGIDYAIAKGLQRFDGGAQGEHKIQRGFEPVLTYSNHWLRDVRFHQTIGQAMQQESESIRQYQRDASTYLPYKNPAI